MVDPVSIVPARCGTGAGAVDSTKVAAVSVSVDDVLAASAENGCAGGVSCAIAIFEVPNKTNVARTVQATVRILIQDNLVITCFLFHYCVVSGEDFLKS